MYYSCILPLLPRVNKSLLVTCYYLYYTRYHPIHANAGCLWFFTCRVEVDVNKVIFIG